MEDDLGLELPVGANHYRAYVGPPTKYDLLAANQFVLLLQLGLREHHKLLDIGCGSLRVGRLIIPYLLTGNYYGTEPNQWLIDKGIENNFGSSILDVKKPHFSNNPEFELTEFNTNFDFILAQSVFTHASQNQIKKCLMMANKVMNKDSIFVASFIESDKNSDKDSWSYPQNVAYRLDLLQGLAFQQNLVLEKLDYKHPNEIAWVKIMLKN